MPMISIDGPGPDGVATATLDRPPANALTREFFVELQALLARLAGDATRALVLTGTGRFFSAGLDLFEVFAADAAGFADFTRHFDAGFAALFAFPKPVVAAVNGHAVAGGAVLAACADFRLVADGGGRIGLTEILVGVPFPASILEIVRHACDGPDLREVVYHGRTYLPAEACQRRLADEVVPAAELPSRARALAAELATREPVAFTETKRALRAEVLSRMAARVPGTDPVWTIWQSVATRAAVDAYRARTLGAKERR
jgi:enoyl-CoA hydratase